MSTNTPDCEHGSIARVCDLCTIDALVAENERLREVLKIAAGGPSHDWITHIAQAALNPQIETEEEK
jgi:hypothetical protein